MDVIQAGTTDVSLLFALSTGGLTISAIKISCVRYDEGDGTSFSVIGPTALTELATITTAHTDNYGKYMDTDTSSGAYFLLRVDVPDTYFASGKDKCVVSVYDDDGAEIAHRIFRLDPVPVNVKEISDDSTAADNLESACDNYSATRGLAGTALPAVAADGAGGLPISDAGGLDLDTMDSNISAIKTKTDNLPEQVKKNTALSNFEFLLVDSTDHFTPKTGLSSVTAERSIDGAAFGSCSNSVTEVSNGIYKINLSTSDLNGDVITLKFTASGADARYITIVTNS